MRILLTLVPLIIASILISCGPGVSGGDDDRLGRYAGEIISTKGLVFYARMEESYGSISDIYGRAIGGAIGFPLYGQMGGMQSPELNTRAIEFDGSNTCFRFGSVDGLNLQPPFSFSLLVNAFAVGPGTIIGSWGNSGDWQWKLYITAGPSIGFDWTANGSTPNPTGGNNSFGIGFPAWNHVVLSVDEFGFARFYVNGTVDQAPGVVIGPILPSNSASITVGCSDGTPGVGGETEFMSGSIDELAIFNRALTHEDAIRMNQARFQ